MLVRESVKAWPEAVVCRVVASSEDAIREAESHPPLILCWDTRLGEEVPETACEIRTLLLGDQSCILPEAQPWAIETPDGYVAGLMRSINREYELRRLVLQLRDARVAAAKRASSVPPSDLPATHSARVSEDRLRAVGRLAAGLAHEVNNPLTFVLANLESLRESHQVIRRFIRSLRVDLSTKEVITPQAFEQIVADANLQEVLDDVADMLTDCYKGTHRIQDIARSLGTFSRSDENQAEMIDITRVVDDACAQPLGTVHGKAVLEQLEPSPEAFRHAGNHHQAVAFLDTQLGGAPHTGAARREEPEHGDERDLVDDELAVAIAGPEAHGAVGERFLFLARVLRLRGG